jgi:hypothetical protein
MVTETSVLPGDLFVFRNFVPADGYRIIEPPPPYAGLITTTSQLLASGPGQRLLVPAVGVAPNVKGEDRWPMQDSPNIAREFAAVGRADADLLAFVGRYGLLKDSWSVEQTRNFQASVRGTVKRLATYRGNWDDKLSAPAARAERRKLADWFNQNAAKHFRFGLELPTSDNRNAAMRVVPTSLMSAIGLLLACEITGSVEWATCECCGKSFARGNPGDYVRSRKANTCSEACSRRLMDQRKAARQAEAKQTAATAAPRVCPHCGDTFTPKPRANAAREHCGKPACKTAASRLRTGSKAK